MLEFLRKSAGSWVAKGLFILLILSFGVWGIGDVVSSGGKQKPAIVVGDIEVPPATIRRTFDQKMEQFRAFLGDQMTPEVARQMGLLDTAIREATQLATLDMLAKTLGVTVSDDAIRAEIVKTKSFLDQNGQFSATQFHTLLAQNNLSEQAYVGMLREGMIRERLQDVLAAETAVPAELANPMFRHEQEQRSAESLSISPLALTPTGAPTQEELDKIYQDNQAAFAAPEYRKVTILPLTNKQLEGRVVISEQEISDYYKASKDTYAIPEQRTVTQVRVKDQAMAEAIAAKVKSGASLAEAASAVGAPAPVSMGALSTGSLPAEVESTVFALPAGGATQALQSRLGWHVFAVGDITPPKQRPLSEVHADIATALRAERAVTMVYEESKALEDLLGGGASLEDAASKMNLPLLTIEQSDSEGKGPDEAPAKGLPTDASEAQTFLKTAFTLGAGEESTLTEMQGGYFIARVDSITPSAPRSQDSVAQQVKDLWKAQKQADLAQALAQDLLSKAQAGESLKALAKGDAIKYVQHDPLTRDGQPIPVADITPAPLLSAAQVKQLFAMKNGETAIVSTNNGPTLIRLGKITEANPEQAHEKMDLLRKTLASALAQDITAEALEAYSKTFGVTINQATIDKAF